LGSGFAELWRPWGATHEATGDVERREHEQHRINPIARVGFTRDPQIGLSYLLDVAFHVSVLAEFIERRLIRVVWHPHERSEAHTSFSLRKCGDAGMQILRFPDSLFLERIFPDTSLEIPCSVT
jgi:hypothetical protein